MHSPETHAGGAYSHGRALVHFRKQSMSSGMFWHEGESGSSVQVLCACVMEEGVKVFLLCL